MSDWTIVKTATSPKQGKEIERKTTIGISNKIYD